MDVLESSGLLKGLCKSIDYVIVVDSAFSSFWCLFIQTE